MAELKQQDKSLWQKIRDWFKDLVADLKALVDAYKGVKPGSAAGQMVAQMQDVITLLEAYYADALVDAGENFQAAGVEKNTTPEGGEAMFSLRGENKDGIEVYETSEEIKKLPYTERQQRFLDIMKNEYRGRTAKFIRNGHAYYATFEESDVNKNIYGDKRSDPKGWKAKINVGADGNIFELVENAQYNGSLREKGKKIAAHKGVDYWDYFIKTVQIDDKVFDLVANVRKKADGAYVYSIQLNQNKTIEASPPRGSLLRALSGVPNASNQRLAQNADDVKEKFSDRDSSYMEAVNRGDMEAAQKMVDEAAKAAGYTNLFCHGSKKGGGFAELRRYESPKRLVQPGVGTKGNENQPTLGCVLKQTMIPFYCGRQNYRRNHNGYWKKDSAVQKGKRDHPGGAGTGFKCHQSGSEQMGVRAMLPGYSTAARTGKLLRCFY